MRILMICSVAAVMTMGLSQALAEDVAAGESLYSKACAQCHGPKAQGMASFPSLAGKDAEYLSSRLEQYRAGEKVGPNSGLMIPNAKGLSDADITNLAAYISNSFQ